uniref:Uncharacterized protein n=1 Tax=Sphaerodactylus townsendi TaxID=933632 RepID=A0ACB8FDK9_9SAUR
MSGGGCSASHDKRMVTSHRTITWQEAVHIEKIMLKGATARKRGADRHLEYTSHSNLVRDQVSVWVLCDKNTPGSTGISTETSKGTLF